MPGRFPCGMDASRIQARDAALRRLRRLTTGAVAVAGLLGLAFSGLAAKAFPGRSSHPTSRVRVARRAAVARKRPTQSPPALVAVDSPSQPPPAPTPAPAPAPTPAPPVAVSGGS